MFDLNEAYSTISVEEIYSKTTEYDLWKYYCKNFESFDKAFRSELYSDNNASCWLFRSDNGGILYKDFGNNGETYNIFQYVQAKYSLSFKECLEVIANDFNIRKSKIILNDQVKVRGPEERLLIKPKSRIEIVTQSFNIVDYKYWGLYHIPLELLQLYDVYSAAYIHLYKYDTITTFKYDKNNPIYAYRFYNEKSDSYVYKIYRPLSPDKANKWMFSGSQYNIEGYTQLPVKGDLLIITKSLKDVMVYRLLGYDAISFQSEVYGISEETMTMLKKRFKKIIVNYDNDEEGIKGSSRLLAQYNLNHYFIDGYKDVSDYVKNEGLDKAKEMIRKKIDECKES